MTALIAMSAEINVDTTSLVKRIKLSEIDDGDVGASIEYLPSDRLRVRLAHGSVQVISHRGLAG
jgi:hypothetical protein